MRLRRGHRFLGQGRWDAPLQKTAGTRLEEDWMRLTEDRDVWDQVLRRRINAPPLPRRRHYVDEWQGDAHRDADPFI